MKTETGIPGTGAAGEAFPGASSLVREKPDVPLNAIVQLASA